MDEKNKKFYNIVMILAFLDGLCTKNVIAMTMVGLMDASTPMN